MAKVRGVYRGLSALPAVRQSVVTIGMFDGVHRAHQVLLKQAVERATRLGAPSIALTFDPDPQIFFSRSKDPVSLMPLEHRCRLILEFGVDAVWVIPFTKNFSRLSAHQFIERILSKRLKASVCIAGKNFVFGQGRKGNMTLLKKIGGKTNMEVIAVAPVRRQGAVVSSSRIRRLVHQGKIAEAAKLLGRPPQIFGRVVRGDGRGKQLGFPTANIQAGHQVMPPHGVYAVRLTGKSQTWDGVMNYGVRPTFHTQPACEVHLFNCRTPLLRTRVTVDVIRYLRAEKRFTGPDQLISQIRRDISRAKKIFSHR